jgi:hypothetical protein
MKKYIPLFILMLFITSCSKDINLTLDITKAEWSTVVSGGFGSVYLKIAGKSNGNKVTIKTYGDGLLNECELELDEDNNFNKDVEIAFTHMPDNTPIKYNTVVKAYGYSTVKEVSLESPELKFID